MNLSTFIKHYLNTLKTLRERKYTLRDDDTKILQFESKLLEMIANNKWEDTFRKACEAKYNSVMAAISEKYYNQSKKGRANWDADLELDQAILNALGINKEPPQALYKSYRLIPAERYVLVFITDYDGPRDRFGRSRNNGLGERFYGDGTAKTRSDFLKQAKATFENTCCEVEEISEICNEPERWVFEYNGYLYTYRR